MIIELLAAASLSFARLSECFPQSLVSAGTGVDRVSSGGQVLPLEITKFHVNSMIQFRYARTQVVSHVKNPGTASNKADFKMVIPNSAFISNFSMIIKGVEYVAEVKETEEAKKTFDEAVSDGKGAGIVSKDTRDANIFTVATNIEPGQKVVFKLIYEELLERKSGLYEHAININPNQIFDDLRVEIFINESLPISKISVPELVQSNEIDASDNEESKIADVEKNVDGYKTNARVVFAPDKLYQEEAGAQGISGQFLVKYDVDRKGQESEVQVIDGYFVHYFVPGNLETLPKHAIFVLDVSGSMDGEKIEQLKDSMFTVLDDMTESDYFNIITFSDGVSHWNPQKDRNSGFVLGDQKAIPSTKENKNNAIKHILQLKAGGGTNINDAMLEGVKIAEYALQNEKIPQEVKSMIVFLTDGLPSSGEINGDAIKVNIKNANSELDVPIFCIGFGRDADFNLIKDISEQANSFSKRIYEGSDAALQLEDFYAEIASPVINNLKFEYVGDLVDNTSTSETSLKTFFKGGEYIIAGKLKDKDIPNNEFLSIKAVGDGKTGPYERNISICLRASHEQEIESSKLLVPIIPPLLCILPPSYPPRSITQDFMQKLHAFINIKQLIKKSDISTEESSNSNKERALKLALENNFVTDLTSLVVIRPDEKPTISSLDKPRSFSGTYSGVSGYSGFISARTPSKSLPVLYDVEYDYSEYEEDYDGFVLKTIGDYETESYEEVDLRSKIDYDLRNTSTECTGNLTLYSKTYLRGDYIVLADESADLVNVAYDNLSVSAFVSGSCCWQIFSEKDFKGKTLLLSSQGTYTSVYSLGELFRETSSAKKHECRMHEVWWSVYF